MVKGKGTSKLPNLLWVMLLLLLGICGLHWVYRDTRLAIQSTRWDTTQGVIVSSKVHRSLGGGRGGTVQWSPRIQYRYVVNGQVHTGHTIRFPARRGAKSEAQRKVNQYPVGGETLSQVITEACLAAAEHNFDDTESVHEKRFLELLPLAVMADQEKSSPTSLGPDSPRGERRRVSDYWLRSSRIGTPSLDGVDL